MQSFTNILIFKILLYFVILQLKNCTCENMTVEQESSLSKPFGSLQDDWKRLDLLQSLQPKNSVLRGDLVKACRLLLNALYQSTSFVNPVEENPPKMAPVFVRNDNSSVESYKNSTSIDDNNRASRLTVTTERLLRLYNRSEEYDVINLQDPNADDNRKLKPMINNHDSLKSIMTSRARAGNKLTTLLPFNNVALLRNSSSNGKNIFENKINTLNAFDKAVEFDIGANSFKPDNLNQDRINKTTKNVHNEMKKTNSSARCGKTDKFNFPAHEFNWTDSLSTTESEMSLQYFNINIFQNTYIGSTTNASITNCSKLAPTEVIPLHSELEDNFKNLVEKVSVTNKKHDSCDSLQARNVIEKDNVSFLERKVGVTNDKNSSNYTKNDLIKGLFAKIEDPTLKSVERATAGSCAVSNSTAGRETYSNDISVKDLSLNSSILSDGVLDLNENNLHQETDSLDKNQGVLLTFNDKVLPNITAVNNGQLMTVPQEQVEQIADLDRVVQKFLDSLYNGSINVKKDDGSMLQDNNILILQGNLTDEKTLGAVSGETKENLKYPSTNQMSNVWSNNGGDQENLRSSNMSQKIDNGTKENWKQPSNNLNSNQSYNISKENVGEMMQVDLKQSSSSNVSNSTNKAYGEHANIKPESNTKLEESPINKLASELQGKLMQTSNVGNKIVEGKQSVNRSVDFGSSNNELQRETVTQTLLKQSDAIFGLENNYSDNSSPLLSLNQDKNISFPGNHDKAIEENFKSSSLNQNNELMNLSRDNGSVNLTTSNKQNNESSNLKSNYDEIRDNIKYSSSNQSNLSTSLKSDDNLMHLKPSSTNETHHKIIPSHEDEMKGNLTVSSFYQSEKLTNSGVYDDINNMKPSLSLNESNTLIKSQKDEINNSITSKCNNNVTHLDNFDDIVKTPAASNNNSAGSELSDLKDQEHEIGGSQLFSNNSDNNKLTNKDSEKSSSSPINQKNELVSLGTNYSNNVVQLNNKNDVYNTISSRNNSNLTTKEVSNKRIISMPSKISNSTINEKSTNISRLHSNGVDDRFGKSTLSIDKENLSNKALQSEDYYLDISTKRSETLSGNTHKQGNDKLVTSIPDSNEYILMTNSSKNAPLSACGDPKEKLSNDKSTVKLMNKECRLNEEEESISQL